MHNLSVATASLAKFQKLAFASIHPSNEQPGIQTSNGSPSTQPEYRQASDTAHGAGGIRRKRLHQEDSPTPILQPSYPPLSPVFQRLSPDIDSECCGGLLDCEDLLDKDRDSDDYIIDRHPSSRMTSRISGLRSTSDYRLGWFDQFYNCYNSRAKKKLDTESHRTSSQVVLTKQVSSFSHKQGSWILDFKWMPNKFIVEFCGKVTHKGDSDSDYG
jgi:hypothetical protein